MSRRISDLLNAIWYEGNPLKWLLWPLGYLYGSLAAARRALYGRGLLRSERVRVPVIVVGNITAGGTGKTPCVIWLAQALRQRSYRVGIVSRGYRGRAEEWPQNVTADGDPDLLGDEPVLIARRTGCPVVAGPDRVAAAEQLLLEQTVDVIVSDDGLQHYRLARDFEIAVIDGYRGLGNGMCLPAGPLRERPGRLSEVDAVVVNSGRYGHAGAFHAELAPLRIYELATGRDSRLEAFKGRRVHAVAGVGNPQRFFDLLEDAGMVVDAVALPDHARIGADDLVFDDDDPVMITEKDAVKCRSFASEGVWCVAIEMRFEDRGDERLVRSLTRQLSTGSNR